MNPQIVDGLPQRNKPKTSVKGVVAIKLPNGYGTVYKLSGKRRKPYVARKTIGWDDEGKQLYSTIGYYKTKAEGLQALAEYNNDPYDLVISKYTFTQIYEKWYSETFDENTNKSTLNNYTNAYKKCSSLYDMKMVDIKLQHLQAVIDNVPDDYKSVDRIKVLFTKLYDWCIKREYLKKNYAINVVLPKAKKSNERRAFKKEHIQKLWDIAPANDIAKIALIYIYCGVRPNELLDLKKENVHLDQQYFEVKKSKTDAGIRIVPIADKVLPFWKHFDEKSKCQYAVCTDEGEKFTYDNFRKRYWNKLMERLELDYYMYETRHTCNTLLVLSNCNPTIRKKIIGHKREMDLGEVVYTHIYIEELLEAINQI